MQDKIFPYKLQHNSLLDRSFFRSFVIYTVFKLNMVQIRTLIIFLFAFSSVYSDEGIMENVSFLSSNYPTPPGDVCFGIETRAFVRNPRGEN